MQPAAMPVVSHGGHFWPKITILKKRLHGVAKKSANAAHYFCDKRTAFPAGLHTVSTGFHQVKSHELCPLSKTRTLQVDFQPDFRFLFPLFTALRGSYC
jgi:hypothetical protein